jgi:integrase
MAKALTVKQIENLMPGESRREVPDGLLPGLYFVLQPSGKASWACRYRANGKPRKLTLGAYPAIDLKTARELARGALSKVAGGADPGVDKKAAKAAARVPVNDMVEAVATRFILQHAKRNMRARTAKEAERILQKEIVGPWRGRRLTQITRGDIHAVLDSIVERGSPIQANRALAMFRTMCRWAIERGLIDANPCTGIRAPAAETARDRILSDDELKAVWRASEALDQPYREFVQLVILSGQRRSEVAEMRWSEIDLDARLWTLPKERAKNGCQHEIPLSDSAVEILRGLPRIAESDFVFTISGRRPICGFSPVKRRLDALLPPDMPPWVFHDLRRTVASGMARLGINLPVIEKLLNHTSGSFAGIVGIYQRHSFADEKRAAMGVWANFVSAVVSGETASNVHYITKV